jgi:hypothetical protein
MVEESETTVMLFEAFKELSNGQTLNHIARVFGTLVSFMHYYNSMHQKRLAQLVRLAFPKHYLEIYRHILPQVKDHLLVSDSLVQLPLIEPPNLKRFALGAFLHDIGKMANLDYFEGAAAYNVNEIQQHVFISSGLILMNYGSDHEEARLMAGDHHNALFHKDGYGVTRMERERAIRKLEDPIRVIGGTPEEYYSGRALGYLPTELLAIIDIYDAMTDASRVYKQAMNPGEAMTFLIEKFVVQGKIDPVLTDLFADFLRQQGMEIPMALGLLPKVHVNHGGP